MCLNNKSLMYVKVKETASVVTLRTRAKHVSPQTMC